MQYLLVNYECDFIGEWSWGPRVAHPAARSLPTCMGHAEEPIFLVCAACLGSAATVHPASSYS